MIGRLRLPSRPERAVLAAAALVWLGAGVGRRVGWMWVMVCVGAALVAWLRWRRGWALVGAACLVSGALSGTLSAAREDATLAAAAPDGPVRLAGWAIDDVRPGRTGEWFLLQPTHFQHSGSWEGWDGPLLLVALDEPIEVAAHTRLEVVGTARPDSGYARGDPFAGRVTARRVVTLAPASDPLFKVGNAVRERIARGLAPYDESASAALVSGFLIGDVRRLPPLEAEQLRRAGLSHFVAVSGSNVAVFLVLWWLVTGPLAFGPRRRAVAGIAGLALFVVITRWEPSVLRAAAMAGLVLGSRAVGIALTPWMALGGAVGGLLLISGELTGDVGFQLSVAATAGVMAGADLFDGLRSRWLATSLGATVSAQVAVAPLLLAAFGAVPLVSPLANLLAAPLVLMATVIGGLGLLTGVDPLVKLALLVGEAVLDIAQFAAPWPQLGVGGLLVLFVGVGAMGIRRLRPLIAVVSAGMFAVTIGFAGTAVERPAAVFLDVGQGDAILVLGSEGETLLVDGGPDPTVLIRKMQEYGVRRLDLMVVTHPHADHVTGLIAAVESMPVGLLWHPGFPNGGEGFDELVAVAGLRGIPVEVPAPGWSATIGSIDLRILGPLRRYASPNDQSLVLLARVGGTSVLLPGDIEVIAQQELGPIKADVLKVPHQGAATSDLDWLTSSAAPVSVISVGPNTFGHPAKEVTDALRAAGSTVLRTDETGDVVVPLGRSVRPSPVNR